MLGVLAVLQGSLKTAMRRLSSPLPAMMSFHPSSSGTTQACVQDVTER